MPAWCGAPVSSGAGSRGDVGREGKKLSELPVGQRGRITRVEADHSIERRLQEMGLIRGEAMGELAVARGGVLRIATVNG